MESLISTFLPLSCRRMYPSSLLLTETLTEAQGSGERDDRHGPGAVLAECRRCLGRRCTGCVDVVDEADARGRPPAREGAADVPAPVGQGRTGLARPRFRTREQR